MKQTAVQWLVEEINKKKAWADPSMLGSIIEQAKAMEKEQIIDAYCDGFYGSGEGWNGEYGLEDFENIAEEINAEQYYNETFKLK